MFQRHRCGIFHLDFFCDLLLCTVSLSFLENFPFYYFLIQILNCNEFLFDCFFKTKNVHCFYFHQLLIFMISKWKLTIMSMLWNTSATVQIEIDWAIKSVNSVPMMLNLIAGIIAGTSCLLTAWHLLIRRLECRAQLISIGIFQKQNMLSVEKYQ